MIAGLDLAVGYLIAWTVSKARRAGAHLDGDVDLVIDTELDRFHDFVAAKLGPDPALARLVESSAEVDELTRTRVELALADATEHDHRFAVALEAMLSELKRAGAAPVVTAAGERSVVVGGNVTIKAEDRSAAAVTMGNVTLAGSQQDPTVPGPEGG
jgi:hypothetical protein